MAFTHTHHSRTGDLHEEENQAQIIITLFLFSLSLNRTQTSILPFRRRGTMWMHAIKARYYTTFIFCHGAQDHSPAHDLCVSVRFPEKQ